MKLFLAATVATALAAGAYGQTRDNPEFEVASIKAVPSPGFFRAADSGNGGPGTADPGLFRCTSCTLSSLIAKAFALQRYEFPGQQSLPNDTYAISARVPAGATEDQFLVMLQNLLKDRFGLVWHFEKKELQGYQLVAVKKGARLTPAKETAEATPPPPAAAEPHNHDAAGGGRPGLSFFYGGAQYRNDHQTMGELAQVLANQLAKPVDDQTGITGKYEIHLSWAGDTAHSGHGQGGGGGFAGGPGHDHDGGGAGGGSGNSASAPEPASGPTLFDALQSQLGLRLVPAARSTARILVIDHVEKAPTAN